MTQKQSIAILKLFFETKIWGLHDSNVQSSQTTKTFLTFQSILSWYGPNPGPFDTRLHHFLIILIWDQRDANSDGRSWRRSRWPLDHRAPRPVSKQTFLTFLFWEELMLQIISEKWVSSHWGWSSGQNPCLQLRRSKFKVCWHICYKILLKWQHQMKLRLNYNQSWNGLNLNWDPWWPREFYCWGVFKPEIVNSRCWR